MENNNNQVFKRNEDANHPFGVQIYPTQKQNAFEDMLGYLENFSSTFEKSGSYDEFMVAYEDEDEEALDKIDPKTQENVLRFKTVLDYLAKQGMISVKNDNKENGGWEILDDVENFDPRKMKQMLLRKHPDEDPYVWMMDDDGDVTMSDGPADEDELATVFSGGKLKKPEEPTGFLGLRKLFNSIKTALGGEPMDAYKKYNKQMKDYERDKYYTLTANGFNVEKPAHVTEQEEREQAKAMETETRNKAQTKRIEEVAEKAHEIAGNVRAVLDAKYKNDPTNEPQKGDPDYEERTRKALFAKSLETVLNDPDSPEARGMRHILTFAVKDKEGKNLIKKMCNWSCKEIQPDAPDAAKTAMANVKAETKKIIAHQNFSPYAVHLVQSEALKKVVNTEQQIYKARTTGAKVEVSKETLQNLKNLDTASKQNDGPNVNGK